jgi:hypothetical protein
MLSITTAGMELWKAIPDPIQLITAVAFDGVDEADIATTNRVLSEATRRLITYKKDGSQS